jgi:hypothetical protein
MALRNLSTETMLSHSAEWLDPNKNVHPLLHKHDATRGLVKRLDTAHSGLLATFRVTDTGDDKLAVIQGQEDAADGLHDRKARGVHGLFTALAELTDHPETREKLLATRDRLFPDGLDVIRWSYSDEAGNALVLAERLDPGTRASLTEIGAHAGAEAFQVDSQLDAMILAGKQLGELEQEKARLTGQPVVPLASRSAARNEWIRLVDLIVRNVESSDEIQAADRSTILDRLRAEEARADHRVAEQRRKNARQKADATKAEPPKG